MASSSSDGNPASANAAIADDIFPSGSSDARFSSSTSTSSSAARARTTRDARARATRGANAREDVVARAAPRERGAATRTRAACEHAAAMARTMCAGTDAARIGSEADDALERRERRNRIE
eukprot:31017-Pelagococcus_subviridis.AAC.19